MPWPELGSKPRLPPKPADANTSSLQHFDDVPASAKESLDRALREAEGRPLVARLILAGIDGAARTLAVPLRARREALGELTRGSSELWLDEAWIEIGGVGAWRIDAAA